MLVKFLRERLTYTNRPEALAWLKIPLQEPSSFKKSNGEDLLREGCTLRTPAESSSGIPLCRVVAKGGILGYPLQSMREQRSLQKPSPFAQGKRRQPCQNPWCTRVTGDTHLTLPLYKAAVREKSGGFRENQGGGQWIWVIKEGPRWWRLL